MYASNGVPDLSANQMIGKCTHLSSDFSDIQVGELLWTEGHVGIYIGGGLGVECTPKFKGGVQITAVGNIAAKPGYNTRIWSKHGKLPYLTYEAKSDTPTSTRPDPAKSYKKAYAGSYTVTADALNMRRGAGILKKTIKVLKKGEKVRCYGYYTKSGLTTWLYVQAADGTIGYCSAKYLK